MLPLLFVPTTNHVQERHRVDTGPRHHVSTIWLRKDWPYECHAVWYKGENAAQDFGDLGPGEFASL